MQAERDVAQSAIGDSFAGGFCRGDGDYGHTAGPRARFALALEEGEIDFLRGFDDGAGFEGRAVESGAEDLAQLRVERLGVESVERFLCGVSQAHFSTSLLRLSASTIGGVPYGKKVGPVDKASRTSSSARFNGLRSTA